jgi:hypothetical protein
MFDSNRFAPENVVFYRAEYDSLTAGTLSMIAASITYFFVVLFMDLSIILCPEAANGMLSACSRKGKRNQLSSPKLLSSQPSEGDGSGELVVNPFMLQKQMISTPSATEDATGAADESAGIIDPAHVAAMVGVPTPTMWRAIQTSYGRLANMQDQLRVKVKDAKKKAEASVVATENLHELKKPTRNRRQFRPMQNGEGEGGVGGNLRLDGGEKDTFDQFNVVPAAARRR